MSAKKALFLPAGILDCDLMHCGSARETWKYLSGRRITNNIVVLNKFGDIHPYVDGPVFDATEVWMIHCDKNFVFYWANQLTFPNAKKLYLDSHPCDPDVLRRGFDTTYLDVQWRQYVRRWAPQSRDVKCINFADIICDYESEQIRYARE